MSISFSLDRVSCELCRFVVVVCVCGVSGELCRFVMVYVCCCRVSVVCGWIRTR